MLAIIARIQLAPKDMDAYIAGAQKVLEPTRAEAGCQIYAIAIDVSEPNVVWISEQWESEETLAAHLSSPHIAEFLELCNAVEITDVNVVKYDVASAGPMEVPQA